MKIKSAKKLGKNFHYRWSTHQPVVRAMVELIKPELILELGVGRYSTPLFVRFPYAQKIIHVESEQGWLDLVKKENLGSITPKSEFRHHDLSGLGIESIKTLPSMLSEHQTNEINKYYNALAHEITTMPYKSSIIFTDGFASCRKSTVDCLTSVTDVMIFHDAEKPAAYGYDKLEPKLYETHDEYLLKTATSWTGFMIKKDIATEFEIKSIIDKYVDIYIKELDIDRKGFELIKK